MELLPCPFCGEQASACASSEDVRDVGFSWVEGQVSAIASCRQCGAKTRTFTLGTGTNCPNDTHKLLVLEQCVAAWNRRVSNVP